jgi:transposase
MIRPGRARRGSFVCVDPVDFRKQIAGLATLVESQLQMNPFSTQLFVFTNRTRRQCRILVWEHSGFVMWQKKLAKERFAWPRRDDAVVTLTGVELNRLIDGYDIWCVRPHQALHYESMT